MFSSFQMAVEMFDYLDDVIALQATSKNISNNKNFPKKNPISISVFSSITTFHVNSMTSAGQCRLAPLIPLIQDSNQLYDFLVRIMFKLHGNLPNDVLQGHRDRFRAIFTQLKSFYGQSRNLQYFVNLITVPKLPESAPNFGSQVDFGSYTAPVVVIPEPDPEPEPEPEQVVDNLVDMSDFHVEQQQVQQQQHYQSQQTPSHSNGGSSTTDGSTSAATNNAQLIDLKRIVQDRDELIRHLQMEVDRLGKCMKSLTIQSRDEQAGLEQQVATLNSQLSDAHESLTNLRFVKEELELKAQSTEKLLVEEERHKASEEKFQKLKVMYASIRDEHIKLLRQHGEVSKQLATATQSTGEATKARDEALQKLEDVRINQSRVEEQLQQSSESTNNERFELGQRVEALESENTALSAKLDDVTASKEAAIEELQQKVGEFEEKVPTLEEAVATKQAEIVRLEQHVEELVQKHEVGSSLQVSLAYSPYPFSSSLFHAIIPHFVIFYRMISLLMHLSFVSLSYFFHIRLPFLTSNVHFGTKPCPLLCPSFPLSGLVSFPTIPLRSFYSQTPIVRLTNAPRSSLTCKIYSSNRKRSTNS